MAGFMFYLVSLFRGRRPSKHLVPIPSVCHLVLTSDDVRDRPVFVVGDVHGCVDELMDLAEKAQEIHDNTLFVFVGDLVNKGPFNKAVLDFVRSLDHYAVRGNHDDAVLRQCLDYRTNPSRQLPASYHWVTCFTDSDVEYLAELPYSIEIPSLKTIVVHAGLVPGVPLHEQDLTHVTHMRNVITQDTFFGPKMIPSEDSNEGVSWATTWRGPEHVYFGHDARRGLQKYTFATGLDTGCLYGKLLTGMFINKNQEMIQIKAHDAYVVVPGQWTSKMP
ncbi:bis(5'-nucleosyl)-tetraphosphatase PrpE [asymmetrical]-like isoform X1 [Gigantopelta aegis]|uniref:bis(5'-nucleosyl)-tetraphosphatase PrpE [asymmetrical]-like isoform X1 n=1 Tax=Gigantopelta aegis TaxID=1735272 RepID=UPI001B889FDF|nr:bis(5'-nucleosyl)-tetraphosphatase PrpE [asymmetrical]-like isoform X1 [Gigantopelta aegis]XP_041348241.1 bis(5'-nucleosyl)-tetraphosphatase PrpE [asymmetrical]-like isoform X1 [Gigantopelta aegis]